MPIFVELLSKLIVQNLINTCNIKGAKIKNGSVEPINLNGASNGIRFEPYCVELMHLCLHDDETIEQIRKFLNYNNFSDISYI